MPANTYGSHAVIWTCNCCCKVCGCDWVPHPK